MICECKDVKCLNCYSRCRSTAVYTLFRTDIPDTFGTPMCNDCLVDAAAKYSCDFVDGVDEEKLGRRRALDVPRSLEFVLYDPGVDLGYLPAFLSEGDPRSASEQFDSNYQHGGGWKPFEGFVMKPNFSIEYKGDQTLWPVAKAELRDEVIFVYPHDWVAIVQPDLSYEICRMD